MLKNQKTKTDYLMIMSALMTVTYITSNVMAVKVIEIFGISIFDAGTVIFPLAYMLGDVLTEIWGFKTAKKVIILTFLCNIFFVAFTAIGTFLPSPDYMSEISSAYSTVYGYVPRILIASLLAFIVGELSNSLILEKIKLKTGEKHLWIRTIGSSVIGHLLDTVIFVLTAFLFTSPLEDIISMILIQYGAKLLIEAIAGTPLAYAAVAFLKKRIS